MENCEYSFEFSIEAENDILEISARFLRLSGENSANRITNKIFKAADQIQFMPYIGPAVHDKKMAKKGFRMYIIEDYLMFYKVNEDDKSVLVYRIVNGKTDYPTTMNWLYD